jgi:hypothetical protein
MEFPDAAGSGSPGDVASSVNRLIGVLVDVLVGVLVGVLIGV